MHSERAKYDQTYYNTRRQQVQSYHRCILTIDPVQQLPIRISAHIFQQLSLKQRTR
ncbi:unnamed protein product [Wuchereria bancrofti]|uniref:Uncharacterized protein n=2 Tax=Wuchereria bancrofti TaxID=6293 RepID=A0A3P7E2N2_WUCBA|nr:unnamed protein product [Wuchereria bancrofti]